MILTTIYIVASCLEFKKLPTHIWNKFSMLSVSIPLLLSVEHTTRRYSLSSCTFHAVCSLPPWVTVSECYAVLSAQCTPILSPIHILSLSLLSLMLHVVSLLQATPTTRENVETTFVASVRSNRCNKARGRRLLFCRAYSNIWRITCHIICT